MRKIALLLLAAVLLASMLSCHAEEMDWSSYSYDTLLTLRKQIDAELALRPENEEYVLEPGKIYTVGKDIIPGVYYAIFDSGDWTSSNIYFYGDDGEQLDYISVSASNYTVYELILLSIRDVRVQVTYNNIRISRAGFPDYHPHEGTTVPVGTYEVGKELPAGKYCAYLLNGSARVRVYPSRDQYEKGFGTILSEYLSKSERAINNIQLNEGNVLVIEENSIVMTKSSFTLTFD